MDIETYRRTVGNYGNTKRDIVIGRDKRQIRIMLIHSPDYKRIVVENRETYVSELVVHVTATETRKNWNTMPDEVLYLGDIIYMETNNLAHRWLVTKIDMDDDVTMSGEMELCNKILRWQNKKTHKLIERWCSIERPYASAINKDYQIITATKEFKCKLPLDDETKLIDTDDRFLLETINGEPKSYHVTSVDNMTNYIDSEDGTAPYGGYIVLSLTQDVGYTAERDDKDIMIADYTETETHDQEPYGEITYRGQPEIRVGSTKKLTAVYYDAGGASIDVPSCEWSIGGDESVTSQITLSADGISATLRAKDNDDLEGKTFTVTCVSNDGISTSLDMKVVIGF